jgi:D-alanyl-D-alanine carboxypeptidase/D-alanyl-D-alanine-endopeptidase (penicillin-binding protein 4)
MQVKYIMKRPDNLIPRRVGGPNLPSACFILFILLGIICQACSPARSIGRFTDQELLQQPGLRSAQVGIRFYDPAAGRSLYDHASDKYFVPASNTKLFTLYAGMKYLGDSLVGMRYRKLGDTALAVLPSGDPTLLHPDFMSQPVIDLLKKAARPVYITDANWQDRPLGRGWAWDDYNDDYMSERSPMPVYGNLIRWVDDSASSSVYTIPEVNWSVHFTPDTTKRNFFVRRSFHENIFEITEGSGRTRQQDVPFITDVNASAALLLKDTIGMPVYAIHHLPRGGSGGTKGSGQMTAGFDVIHSRPVDSMFRPMMLHSDNFFAEQTLLMVSNERLGNMNDVRIIDTLLAGDLKDLPQKPNWVDGSGLSRYDLFSPQDFVVLLGKLKDEFGLPRLEKILPTGGTGTLGSYYREDSGRIFAKTGSLSGVVALSGYLFTKRNHLYIFSILINNYTGSGVTVRRQMEKLVHLVRDKY